MIRRRAQVFLALMLLLVAGASPAAAMLRSSGRLWLSAGATAWQAGLRTGLTTSGGSLTLSPTASPAPASLGAYSHFGIFDSSEQRMEPFRRVLVDYHASVPAGAQLLFFVHASADGRRWSEWEPASAGQTISIDRIATRLQYRAVLLGQQQSPALDRVALSTLPLSQADYAVRALDDQVAPTYKIRATREGLVGNHTANGHRVRYMDRFVSLPSWRSLSPEGSDQFMVRITNPENGRSTIAPVYDVGPWNEHDDYWNADRQRYADLPVGWPEDHAAYYDGYNHGRAEKGRVLWPSGLDVGDGTWVEDLGIAFNEEQATVYITFLWQGSDPGDSPVPGLPKPAAQEPEPDPAPSEEGAITVDDQDPGFTINDAPWHEIECGQGNHSLWTGTTNNPDWSENVGIWRPSLPAAGDYDVYAFVPYCRNGRADTRSARYEIAHGESVDIVEVNQAEQAGQWVHLGRWSFAAGETGYVRLTDLTGDRRRSIWYDAMKWVPAPAE